MSLFRKRTVMRPLRRAGDSAPYHVGLVLLIAALNYSAVAAEKAFTLGGVSMVLEEVTSDVEVRYQSMRLNRALNVWNVEVTIAPKAGRTLRGPFLLLVDEFIGTSGPLLTDGADDIAPTKQFYDLSNWVPQDRLGPGTASLPRTLSLGFVGGGAPRLSTRVYSTVAGRHAVALARSLNEAGQPLPNVQVLETGPSGETTYQTDAPHGLATLGGVSGAYIWKFHAPEYVPVWRAQTLSSDSATDVALVHNPRLTRRSTNGVIIRAAEAGQVASVDRELRVTFPPNSFSQDSTVILTPLTAQTLPAILPQGWSPLQGFWLELDAQPIAPVSASLRLRGSLNAGETAALVRLDTNSVQWIVTQLVPGNGTNTITTTLAGSGAYAVVVADTGATPPPAAQVGQPLQASGASPPDVRLLTAGGRVDPRTSAASRVAELVTARASIAISNQSEPLPSGLLLRGEFSEDYRLRDGTRRIPPRYESFLMGYQRPGDNEAATLHADFPVRPQLLLGAEELERATITVDVLSPSAFNGVTVPPSGAQLVDGDIRIIIGTNSAPRADAVEAAYIRRLNPTNFANFVSGAATIERAFELTVTGGELQRRIAAQFSGVPTNGVFVLAKVVSRHGQAGLEPRERLVSNSRDNLVSAEPGQGERLPGIAGGGQYILLRLTAPQALVTGVARNSTGEPAADFLVRIAPWLTFSAAAGEFRLLAPVGSSEVVVSDPATGDMGRTTVVVTDPSQPVETGPSTAAVGPRVVSISPTNNATRVARVTPIAIHFSEPVNPGTLVITGAVQILATNGQSIAASVSPNLQNTIVTLLPGSPLPPSALHSVVLSTNITDLTGRRLEGPNTFTFTTETDALDRLQTAQVVSYEPVNGRAAMTGSPGIAEPESPVILVNETTGRTSTILSKPDGSFTNSIEAGVDDFLSAVFVNRNGTRNEVRQSRQIFRDGSVALFNGGGTIVEPGEHGPVQILVEAGSISGKTKVKIETPPLTEVLATVRNTAPANGKVLGGIKVNMEGDALSVSADVSFPINPADLGLPAGAKPEEAGYALAVPREVDGVIVYEIIDRMQYEDGKLVTHSLPFFGLGAFLAYPILVTPLMFTVGDSMTIFGQVGWAPQNVSTGPTVITEVLPGAFVTVSPGGTQGPPGRLAAGSIYAVTGRNGNFAFLVPATRFLDSTPDAVPVILPVVVRATHPRFFGRAAYEVVTFPSRLERFAIGNAFGPVDVIFELDHTPAGDPIKPNLSLSHTPSRPAVGASATVRAVATDNASRPDIQFAIESVLSTVPGVSATVDDVQWHFEAGETSGDLGQRNFYSVTASKPLKVVLRITAVDGVGHQRIASHSIIFGTPATGGDTEIPPSDPDDSTGPQVSFFQPAAGSSSLSPGNPIILAFNEPIERAVLHDAEAIALSPGTLAPLLELSPDQQVLTARFPDLRPNTDYTLTVSSGIRDLVGNPFDQDPALDGRNPFVLNFKTAPSPAGSLPGVESGGGALVRGRYAYVLERKGSLDGSVVVYDLSQPATPTKVAELGVPGAPRDLALIPNYSFKRDTNAAIETKDLLAIVGGKIGAPVNEGQVGLGVGQYLWVIDISDPLAPKRVAARAVTFSPSAAVTKVVWTAPLLSYLEIGDVPSISFINLQSFILGELFHTEVPGGGVLWPPQGTPGGDANGDGDYVDPGDELPLPARRAEIAGKVLTLTVPDTDQFITDYSVEPGYVGVLLEPGTLRGTNTAVPGGYRTLLKDQVSLEREVASFAFTNGRPTRLTTLFGYPLAVSNRVSAVDLALVSVNGENGGSNRLVVLDITDATQARVVAEVIIPSANGEFLYTTKLRDDGMLLLATTRDIILIDPARFGESMLPYPGAQHPSIAGRIAGAGSGARTFGSLRAGLTVSSLASRNGIIQTAPALEIISLPGTAPFSPVSLVDTNAEDLQRLLASATVESELLPSRYRDEGGIATSSLTPPQYQTHYYVLVHAPGSAGPTIELGLQSLNWAGNALFSKGFLFPPVHALSGDALAAMGQTPLPTDAPIASCRAWRLSSDPANSLYNVFLSRPLALVYEEISKDQLLSLRAELDREILWSGAFLRAFIDPSMATNPVLGPFTSKVDSGTKQISPGPMALAAALPADNLQGPNPGPMLGAVALVTALESVGAHNAEFMVNTTDIALPGRRLPLEFRRSGHGQGLYEGPFGRGWDFNFNQRLVELKESIIPAGVKIPLVVRDNLSESEIAESKDLFFHTGAGQIVLYKFAGTNPPPEVASDPLLAQLGWAGSATRYYLPLSGVFNFFVKFRDSRYARLEPDGTQYWYNSAGKLIKIYDRYDTNSLELVYNERGELIQILDELRRALDIGYWRVENDPNSRTADRTTSSAAVAGKISRLSDYSGRDVLFHYTADGLLERREGPEVTVGEPSSFRGRQITRYLYSGTDNADLTGKSLIGVVAGDATGIPLLKATDLGAQGRDTVRTLQIAGGIVEVTLSQANTAKTLSAGNGSATAKGPDGSETAYQFDKFGRPSEFTLSGNAAPPQKTIIDYHDNGLTKTETFPEGNVTEYEYDVENLNIRSRGNLLRVTKKPGPRGGPILTASTQYDPTYNLPAGTKTDYNGVEAFISLTPDKRDTHQITLGGQTETYAVNEFGQVTNHVAIDGVVRAMAYNANGFIASESLGGFASIYEYEGNSGKRGLETRITDARGIVTQMVWDERNQLVRKSRAGVIMTYTYDENGNVTQAANTVDDGKRLVEQRTYNQVGFMTERRLKNIEAEGGSQDFVVTYVPNEVNRVKKATFPGGEVHSWEYDHAGQVTKYSVGNDYSEAYTYDRNGNHVTTKIGAATETYTFDGHDRLITTLAPNNTRIGFSWDGNANLLTNVLQDSTGAVLAEVSSTYDSLNRAGTILRRRDTGYVTNLYSYNSANRSITVVGPLGDVTTSFYDTAGRLTKEVGPAATIHITYDENGNVKSRTSEENGQSFTQFYSFNDRDQCTHVVDNAGHTVTFALRLDGQLKTVNDREGHSTHFSHTLLGEVAQRRDGNGVTLNYRYTPRRQLSSIKDILEQGIVHTYDSSGRLKSTRLQNNASTTFDEFHALNSPQTISLPRSIVGHSIFDSEGKLQSRTLTGLGPPRLETFTYDGLNRPKVVSSPHSSEDADYDRLGATRQWSFTYKGFVTNEPSISDLTFSISQQVDDGSYRAEITYPDASVTVTNRRDNLGRLLALNPSSGEVVIYTNEYATATQVGGRILGENRIRLENRYDSLKQTLVRRYTRISDDKPLAEVRYARDKNGLQVARQFVHRAGRTDFLTYDPGYRLQRADLGVRPVISNAEPARAFAGFTIPVSVVGAWAPGRFARAMTYSETDVLQSVAAVNPDNLALPAMASAFSPPDEFLHVPQIDGFVRTRDEIGNVTRTRLWVRLPNASDPAPVDADLSYNDLGQLVRIVRNDGVVIENIYGVSGLRIRRTVRGPPSHCAPSDVAFVYDEANLIEERDLAAGGSLMARYYYGDEADELVAGDILLPSSTNLARRYFLTDTLGSVLAITDDAGKVLEGISYDAWGQPTIQAADVAPPRVARILADGNDLLVVFTEPVLPNFVSSLLATGLVSALKNPRDIFEVRVDGQAVWPPADPTAAAAVYEENLAGQVFGSVFRLRFSASLSGAVEVRVREAGLQDEWNNPNPAEALSLNLTVHAGTPLFSGPALGSTMPRKLARSAVNSSFLFQGQVFDFDAGLVYQRARFYDPGIGMFLQPDPLGYEEGVNHYAGFAHNPINLRDPTGLSSYDPDALGKTLQAQGEAGGGFFGAVYQVAGFVLQLGTGAAEGYEMLNSDRRGTVGVLDRIRGSRLIADDISTATLAVGAGYAGVKATVAGANLARRTAGYMNKLPSRALAHLRTPSSKPLTDFQMRKGLRAVGFSSRQADEIVPCLDRQGIRSYTPEAFRKETLRVRQGRLLEPKQKNSGPLEKIEFVGKGDDLGVANQRTAPQPGYQDVLMHGDAGDFWINESGVWHKFSPKDVAQMIRQSGKWKGGPIRLISCNTGSVANGAAQQLANELGVKVVAPNSTAWVGRANPSVGTMRPYLIDRSLGVRVNMPHKNSGAWIGFFPGNTR
jgi:RHS repeat-associated protein